MIKCSSCGDMFPDDYDMQGDEWFCWCKDCGDYSLHIVYDVFTPDTKKPPEGGSDVTEG